jgi:GDP-L-fucose synthase
MSLRVLLLGGTGFLGSHAARRLQDHGYDVVSASRRTGVDLLDSDAFAARVAEVAPDAIVNCAAHVGSVHYAIANAATMIYENTQLLVNMYEAVRASAPGAVVVNPLSNCSYPGDADVHYEPDWERGAVHDSVLAYGSVKRLAYAFAESYRKQHGIRSVNWLVANAYGPGDHLDPNKVHALNGIVIRLIEAKRAGAETFEIWGSGRPLREWVYVDDVARLLAESVLFDEQTYPMNIAQHKAYSISEIAQIAADALDYGVELTYDTSKPDGAPVKILDDRAFRAAYPGFEFTTLAEGIAATVDYYERALQSA